MTASDSASSDVQVTPTKQMRKLKLQRKCDVFLIVVGVFVIISGVAMATIFDVFFDDIVKETMTLKEGTIAFREWKDPTAKLYFKFFMFDLKNVDEVAKGAKPLVEEHGPYTYDMYAPKTEMVWNTNGTISYLMPQWLTFSRKESVGEESDTFTSINIPMMTLIAMMADKAEFEKEAMAVMLDDVFHAKLFQELSVRDIIWGYQDALIKFIHKFQPSKMPEKFGFLYQKNGTSFGRYNVYTGIRESKRFCEMDKFNYRRNLTYWTNDEANMINGTDGLMFAPFLSKKDILRAFAPEMCRSIYFKYEKLVEFKGLNLWRYAIPSDMLQSGAKNKDNAGFCIDNKCLPDGLLDVSTCQNGAPIAMSWPHFYMADPSVASSVVGLKPVKELHETVVDAVPKLGVLPFLARREQVNMLMEKVEGFHQTKSLRHLYLPVLWMEVSAVLDDETANYIKYSFQLVYQLCHLIGYVAVAPIGVLLVAVAARRYKMHSKKLSQLTNPERQKLINASEEDT